ncbi:unnamed protein product [Dibothriocephalus latus]|uniref:Uncharacterized protein n=1 Tax=Dibothriocephalus latus TaxID=60516 RepID=A0A3P7P2W3_DIBLA|nr:unnamed protein product [Dibothriocephalus latus]
MSYVTQLALMNAKWDATQTNLSAAPISMPPARTECPVPSPMTSMEEFDAFEERLLDTKYWHSRRYEFSLFYLVSKRRSSKASNSAGGTGHSVWTGGIEIGSSRPHSPLRP